MASDATTMVEPDLDLHEPAPPKRRGMKRFYVALLVGGIMAAEGLLGWWVLSNRTGTGPSSASGGDGTSLAVSEDQESPDADAVPAKTLDVQEVEIGDFQLTNLMLNGSTIHVQIHFTATVDKEAHQEFQALFEKHRFRIRQRILSILRSSTEEDLADPSFELIRRKVQHQLNQLLERSVIENIIFTDAHVMTQ